MTEFDIKREFDLYLENSIKNINQLKNQISKDNIQALVGNMIQCFDKGGKLIFCGNGGSASDCQHLVAEFIGRYKVDRRPLPAIALNSDTSVITALSNDLGYEKVFERQVNALGNSKDMLFAISTSGESINIINAVYAAKKMKILTVGFTKTGNSSLSSLVDILIDVPSNKVNHIQEMHIMIGHFICEIIENHYHDSN